MSKTKRTKSKSAIQAVTVERGIWTTTIQAYRDVVAESRFPLDILVMVVYDQIVAAGGATFWQLKATSNGSFFLLPEKKRRPSRLSLPTATGSVFRSRFPASSRLYSRSKN